MEYVRHATEEGGMVSRKLPACLPPRRAVSYMEKPHIYTMPEAFIRDQEVPARWRLLALLNGFFLNNMKCWMSNEKLGQQLGCHENTVTRAVEELENLNIIRCERTRRSRLISSVLHETTIDSGLRPPSVPVSDHHQYISNSVTNSDKIHSSAEAENDSDLEIEPDEDLVPTKKFGKRAEPSVEKEVLTLFGWFSEINPAYLMWRRVPAQRDAAKQLLAKYGLEKTKVLFDYAVEVKDDPFAPHVTSPYELLTKLSKLRKYADK